MLLRTKRITLLTLFLLTISVGCSRDMVINTDISTDEMMEILIIGPYLETCMGAFFEYPCYLEYNEKSQAWKAFGERIQGFNFEPGYIWTLKVRLEDRGPEIQDVGRYAYHLVEVLSKVAAPVDEKPPRKPL